jgi:hypothetical protein
MINMINMTRMMRRHMNYQYTFGFFGDLVIGVKVIICDEWNVNSGLACVDTSSMNDME